MAANVYYKPSAKVHKKFIGQLKTPDSNVIPLLIRGHGTNYKYKVIEKNDESKEHVLEEPPEEERTFILPPNCYVVAKAHPGKRIYESEYIQLHENLCKMDYDVITNPLGYDGNKLFDAFKSVMIYKPNEPCPNFEYTLLSYWNEKDSIEIFPYGSGVINIDYLRRIVCKNKYNMPLNFDFEGCNRFVESIFKYSLSPKSSDIPGFIKQFEEKVLPLHIEYILSDKSRLWYNYVRLMFKYFEKEHRDIFIKTQKTLCEELASNPNKTYIFYNFICRTVYYTPKFFINNTNVNNYTTNILRNNVNLKNAYLRRLLRQTIEESMRYRREQSRKAMTYRYNKSLKKQENKKSRNKNIHTNDTDE